MVKFHITTNPIITQFVNVKPGTSFLIGFLTANHDMPWWDSAMLAMLWSLLILSK